MDFLTWRPGTEGIGRFLGELRRRRVWRTAFAYAASVFVVLQLAEIVFPAFGAPDLALRLLVVVSFLGFPLALSLAWVFDITPTGIQRSGADAVVGIDRDPGSALPRLALLAVTLATVGGVGWWAVQDTLEAEPATAAESPSGAIPASDLGGEEALQVRSLAVLPLDDFSQEEGGEYFTAGLHEELVFQLSQIGAARVLSRTTVVQYDRKGKTMPVVARELGVEGVVEGSVFRDGDRVKITVQLIHGATDQHLWSNTYEGTMEDAIALQRTVAQAIAGEIRAELFPDEKEPPGRLARVASNPEAQEEYLKGRFEQSKGSPDALASAIGHYEMALALDSSFAPAYAGLAAARLLLGLQSQEDDPSDPTLDTRVTEPLRRALALDHRSPEARAILYTLDRSVGTAVMEPDPDPASAVSLSAGTDGPVEVEVSLAGSEFGRQLQRVILSHPRPGAPELSPARRLAAARGLEATAAFGEAEAEIREVLNDAPGSAEAWEALERLKTVQGDYQGAVEVRQDRLARDAEYVEQAASVGELRQQVQRSGAEGYWSLRQEELTARQAEGRAVSSLELARTAMGLGQAEEALRRLKEAVTGRERGLVFLWTDPGWDSLRTDPRFREILSSVRGGGGPDAAPHLHRAP